MDAQNLKGALNRALQGTPCTSCHAKEMRKSMNHDQAIRAFISSMPTVMQTLRSTSSRRLGAKIDGSFGNYLVF